MAERLGRIVYVYGLAMSLGAAAPPFSHPPQEGSKSNQWFGRGLELDHGTDFALAIGGIPLNTPSHVRGPGFLNDAILIGEVLEGTQYTKGLYGAEQGAFAVAGSASRDLAPALDHAVLGFTYGGAATDRYARLLWAAPLTRGTYALEFSRAERPWDDLTGSSRLNAAFRKDGEGPRGRWTFTALGSDDRSDSGGATPARPFPPGMGSVSDAKAGDGIRTRRLLLGWTRVREEGPHRSVRFNAYAGAHHQRLFNDWTYYLRNPIDGDQLELTDRRAFFGADCGWTRIVPRGGVEWLHAWGWEARVDRVSAGVHNSRDRERLAATPIPGQWARADLLHGALRVQSTLRWERWEAFAGLRLDAQRNRTQDVSGPWTPQDRGQVLGSPKAGLSCSPAEGALIALKAGQGFRLGDAFREAQPMVRARSTEALFQVRPARPWTSSLTFWRLDLEAETLFDAGLNAFRSWGPARHQGVEFYNVVRQGPWHVECALDWNRAVLKDAPHGLDRVPYALPRTARVGVGWKGQGRSLEAKWLHTGRRPLLPDGSLWAARESALALSVQEEWGPWTLGLEVLNTFSLKTYNHEFYYPSRFPDEAPAGVWDRHLKTADPQAIRIEVRRRF